MHGMRQVIRTEGCGKHVMILDGTIIALAQHAQVRLTMPCHAPWPSQPPPTRNLHASLELRTMRDMYVCMYVSKDQDFLAAIGKIRSIPCNPLFGNSLGIAPFLCAGNVRDTVRVKFICQGKRCSGSSPGRNWLVRCMRNASGAECMIEEGLGLKQKSKPQLHPIASTSHRIVSKSLLHPH